MQFKEDYLGQLGEEVQELASRIALLNRRFTAQRFSEKLQYLWDVAHLQTRCAEFKRHIEELEDADELKVEQSHSSVEGDWNDLMRTVNTLLSSLPEAVESLVV
jgi:uncharacterized small protein (DUF1192 family)